MVLTGFCHKVQQAIGEHDVAGRNDLVVAPGLMEHFLIDGNLWGFALNQYIGLALLVGQYIKALLGAVQHQASFNGQVAQWYAQVMKEVVNYVLPNPFFRGEGHHFFAHHIIDLGLAGLALHGYIDGREMEFHGAKVCKIAGATLP